MAVALEKARLARNNWKQIGYDAYQVAEDCQLASEVDLSWQPQVHHITEERLGLTPAQLRGKLKSLELICKQKLKLPTV